MSERKQARQFLPSLVLLLQIQVILAPLARNLKNFKADGTKSAKWFSEVDRVCGCLDTAFTMFVGNIDVFNDYFKLGVGVNSAIAAFAKEVQDLD